MVIFNQNYVCYELRELYLILFIVYSGGGAMSGSQHGFQSSFANSQQAAMRNQFVGGPGSQIPGLMAPNQQAGEFGISKYEHCYNQ